MARSDTLPKNDKGEVNAADAFVSHLKALGNRTTRVVPVVEAPRLYVGDTLGPQLSEEHRVVLRVALPVFRAWAATFGRRPGHPLRAYTLRHLLFGGLMLLLHVRARVGPSAGQTP